MLSCSYKEPSDFHHFLTEIEKFKNTLSPIHSARRNAFSDNNFAILKAWCNRIQCAENDLFYTKEELDILIAANKKTSLQAMKKGVQVSIKQKKYHAAMEEFNAPDEKNIFYVFKNHPHNKDDENKIAALDELKAAWQRRKHLGHISSAGLGELQEALNKLTEYAKILQEDFALQKSSYWNWINADVRKEQQETTKIANKFINDLKILIQKERKTIAQAMLERLAMVPGEHLLELTFSRHQSTTAFNDDVVFATLKAFIPFGLQTSYVEDFMQQAPPHQTLTDNLILQFNDFVISHGTPEQKARLQQLYSPNHAGHQDLPNTVKPLTDDTDTILIPTKMANQYNIRISTKDNLAESFVFVEKPLDMSFHDVSEDKTIYIPMDGLSHSKVECKNEEELSEFYDVLTKKTIIVPDLIINQFNTNLKEMEEFFELKQKFLKFLDKECIRVGTHSFNFLMDPAKTKEKIDKINDAFYETKQKKNITELKAHINELSDTKKLTQNRRHSFFCGSATSTLKENIDEFILLRIR